MGLEETGLGEGLGWRELGSTSAQSKGRPVRVPRRLLQPYPGCVLEWEGLVLLFASSYILGRNGDPGLPAE